MLIATHPRVDVKALAQDAQRLTGDEPAAVAVVEGELWVAYEAERLPLGRIIDGLLRHDPNCQELGQRLHTRVDIEWGVG